MPEDDEDLVIKNQSVSKVDGGSDESRHIDLSETEKRDDGPPGSGVVPSKDRDARPQDDD